jgi:methylthioxylose transferase
MATCEKRAGRLSERALWTWLAIGALASLLVTYEITTQVIVLGSREGGWIYGYLEPFTTRTLGVSLLATALCAGLLFSVAPAPRVDWLALFAWISLAFGVDWLIRSQTPFTFEQIFNSPGANSFYNVTQRVGAASVLREFDRLRSSWPLHAQSNMPGKLMLIYALRLVSEQPGALAWLVVGVANLGAALMYVFVRELFADRRIAIYSAVLYLVAPAKLYFFPLLNTVTPVIVLACAVLLLACLRRGRVVYAAALGVVLFVLAFFEPLPLVIGLLFALFVGRALWLRQITPLKLLTQMAVAIAACAAAYGTMRLLFGFNLITAFAQIGEHARRFNEDAGRPYTIWVWGNLRDFFFGVGVCQAVVFCAAFVDGFRDGDSWREALMRPITLLCIGALAVLLAIDVLGVNRGEVIRLWIFLACFFQIPTAYVCARLDTPLALMLVIAVTVLQSAVGTAMIGFILP